MNKKEQMAVQPTNEIVADMLRQRNKGTEDCITTSEYARKIGMNAPDLNRFLEDQNVMQSAIDTEVSGMWTNQEPLYF